MVLFTFFLFTCRLNESKMSEIGDVIGQLVASGEATHDELGFSEKEARLLAEKYLSVFPTTKLFCRH